MTPFWIVVVAMIAAAVLVLVIPLLSHRGLLSNRDQQNIDIAKERLQELKTEHLSGAITADQFEKDRIDVEQILNDDLTAFLPDGHEIRSQGSWVTAAVLVVTVPILATILYLNLGSQGLVEAVSQPKSQSLAQNNATPSVEQMVTGLAARIANNPNDVKGLAMLGRSYMVMKRYSEAAEIFEKLHGLVGDQPGVLIQYADALAMANGGRLSGKPALLVEKALSIKSDDPTGLWLAGMAKAEQGEAEAALGYWYRLRSSLESDPESLAQIDQLISKAEEQLDGSVPTSAMSQQILPAPSEPAVASMEGIMVTVDLDPTLTKDTNPHDALFVFAQAVQGPPMPLAVVRKQVKDLPLQVALNDSMAMMPTMKLSNFKVVRIGARISKSGNAIPQSGDLEGKVEPVTVGGGSMVRVLIKNRVP